MKRIVRYTAIVLSLVLSLLLLTGCYRQCVQKGNWIKKIDSEEASRLMLNFAANAKRKHRVDLEDSRLVYDDTIEKWYIEFSSQRLVTMCEARLLLVELVEEFLYCLNNHTVLSFDLRRFPFTAEDIEMKINFESFYGRFADELYIGLIWLKCGCAYYYAFDRKDPDIFRGPIDWSHDRWEPYFKSRELALLKRIADIDPIDCINNPPAKPSSFIYERYSPSIP